MFAYQDMKHLESSESSQIKSQNDRTSPEIPHDSCAISRVPARVCDFEGGAVCSKNSTFGYSTTSVTRTLKGNEKQFEYSEGFELSGSKAKFNFQC